MATKAKGLKGQQRQKALALSSAQYRDMVKALVASNAKDGARSKVSMALRKALRRSKQWPKRKVFLGKDALSKLSVQKRKALVSKPKGQDIVKDTPTKPTTILVP